MIKIGQVYEYCHKNFTIVAQSTRYNGTWDAKDDKGIIKLGWIDNTSLRCVKLISDIDTDDATNSIDWELIPEIILISKSRFELIGD